MQRGIINTLTFEFRHLQMLNIVLILKYKETSVLHYHLFVFILLFKQVQERIFAK